MTTLSKWTALSLMAVAPRLSAQDAMFRGGPEHFGVSSSAAPSLTTVVWKYKTNGRVISSPAVSDGVLYVGSTDNSLYALSQADGSLKWKFATRGPILSSPAVAGGLVYFGSLDGNIYAVETATGKERWHFATKGERRFTAPGIHGAMPRTERMPDPFDVFMSSPTVAGGMVFVGSGDQNVYALDAASGAVKWTFSTGDVVHASPAVANGVVYIGSGTCTRSMPRRGRSDGATRPATTRSSTTRSASPARRPSPMGSCSSADAMGSSTSLTQ
jgi:outer membrane protein assembly factor BamB